MLIYIAEDEPLAAQKLQLFLNKTGERTEDITVFSSGVSLIEALRAAQSLPDVLFLDIQMPGMTGIDVLRELQADARLSAIKVVITSAFDQYAIDGFNFGVADYLLKPYTLDRLRQSLAKVKPEPVISIRCEGRNERLRVADIICLEALKDYTRFTLIDGRQLTTLGTLTGFEQQLPTTRFARVQRSYIVALAHVKSYNSQHVILAGDIDVPLGKVYREAFEQAISQS